MANIYYSDKMGTNLNVFEKKTKGGEPFYYIYLNKTKITESDVGKLTKIMQDALPQRTINIKTKKGKIAYQITWSYDSATPLTSEEILFDAMFSYLVTYGYVDSYQPKSGQVKLTRGKSVTPPTSSATPQLPNLTNAQGVPLINVENTSVIKKGDLFYFYLSLESPCYISDFDSSTNNFSFTRYVRPNVPQYESGVESMLRDFIRKDEAFLCKTTDGGYFVNNEDTFSLLIEPMKSDGSFEMIINEDGAIRKGGLPNEEQLAMFICANKLMPKLAPTQQGTTTQSNSNMDDDIKIPTKILQVGDEFYYNSEFNKKRNFRNDLYKILSITNDKLDLTWNDDVGNPRFLNGWATTSEAQEFVKDGTITFPKGTSISFNFGLNDILWYDNFPYQIFRITKVDVVNDVFNYQFYNDSAQQFLDGGFKISDVVDHIIDDITFKKLEDGDVFESKSHISYTIIQIDNLSSGKNIIYEIKSVSGTNTYTRTELDFIESLQKYEMKWVTTNMVASTSTTPTTPMQVGDKFIFCDIPFKPTKQELDNVRKVIKINTNTEELTFEFKSGDQLIIDFDVIRKGIDEGECIIISSANQSAQTTSEITSLKVYDLMYRVADGKLFRVLNVQGIIQRKDGEFPNIPDDRLVELEDYDAIASDFQIQQIRFVDLKNNFFRGELNYLGQVREGDSFVAHDNNMERFVKDVDNNGDVTFKISDLNFTPPQILNTDNLVMNVFTRSLMQQGYKFNLRLGDTSNTPTPSSTPTPQSATSVTSKPQINSSEINALKKELSDLIFLKSGVSDLDFEEKMNISSEIYDVQKKVNDLNEKLFEQSVGDEQFFDKLFEQSFVPLRDRYDLVITENNLNELLSPNGEISDLNEDLQVIVNSKEFKEWFGDWRNAFFYRNLPDFGGLNISKVLNDKFEPQIVWHGTNNEFSYFDFENFPANYFAVNKEYSEFFAINKGSRGYVLPFFLDIKNPLDLSSFGSNYVSTKDFFDWMYLMTGLSAEELEVNPLFLDPNLQPNPIWVYIRNNATMLQKIAQGRVYDGIKFYEFNPNEENNPDKNAYETLAYIIFDPHQAKLADPSRGEILLASLKSFMLKRGGKI